MSFLTQSGIQKISLDSRFPFDFAQGKRGNDKKRRSVFR